MPYPRRSARPRPPSPRQRSPHLLLHPTTKKRMLRRTLLLMMKKPQPSQREAPKPLPPLLRRAQPRKQRRATRRPTRPPAQTLKKRKNPQRSLLRPSQGAELQKQRKTLKPKRLLPPRRTLAISKAQAPTPRPQLQLRLPLPDPMPRVLVLVLENHPQHQRQHPRRPPQTQTRKSRSWSLLDPLLDLGLCLPNPALLSRTGPRRATTKTLKTERVRTPAMRTRSRGTCPLCLPVRF